MKKLFLSVLFGGLCFMASAQSASLLYLPSEARTAAMGGTGLALDGNSSVVAGGMSVAALSERLASFGAGYFSWAPAISGLSLVNLDGYYRFGKLAVGINGQYCMGRPYDVISNVSKVIGSYRPTDLILGAGVAYRIIDPLSVGVSVRILQSKLSENVSKSAVAADVTVSYKTGGLLASAGVANLGSAASLARLGASYKLGSFQASAQADYLFSGAFMAGVGAEYGFLDIVFVRAGFHYGDAAKALPTYASLGVGVQYWGIRLDAAWLTASKVLGNSLGFALSYSF